MRNDRNVPDALLEIPRSDGLQELLGKEPGHAGDLHLRTGNLSRTFRDRLRHPVDVTVGRVKDDIIC